MRQAADARIFLMPRLDRRVASASGPGQVDAPRLATISSARTIIVGSVPFPICRSVIKLPPRRSTRSPRTSF
jgi:hypothetical protein